MNKALAAALMLALTALASTGYYLHDTQTKKLRTTPTPTTAMYDAWFHWKAKYGRTYATPTEEAYRMSCWMVNYMIVMASNIQKDTTFKLGLNNFADVSNEEFKTLNAGSLKTNMLPK